jgi:Domain of unknown function (DUF4352)
LELGQEINMKNTKKITTQTRNLDSRIMRIQPVLATVAILFLGFTTLLYQSKYTNALQELSDYKNGYSLSTNELGTTAETPDFNITLNSVTYDDKGLVGYIVPPEGMQFVAVDLSVKNKTSSDKMFLPIDSTYVKDQTNIKYFLTTAPNVQEGVAGTVAAGDTVKGQIGYLVPKATTKLNFYFIPYSQTPGKTINFRVK